MKITIQLETDEERTAFGEAFADLLSPDGVSVSEVNMIRRILLLLKSRLRRVL